ncbi:MAG: hypothetical protein ACR2G8_09110, partial [Candidatus Limnocylindria bacterium]
PRCAAGSSAWWTSASIARSTTPRGPDAFAARLGDQVDLDALEREVLGVVGRTVQPAHAALWLRERPR